MAGGFQHDEGGPSGQDDWDESGQVDCVAVVEPASRRGWKLGSFGAKAQPGTAYEYWDIRLLYEVAAVMPVIKAGAPETRGYTAQGKLRFCVFLLPHPTPIAAANLRKAPLPITTLLNMVKIWSDSISWKV